MSNICLEHAKLNQFSVYNDCLYIGKMPLTRLAQRVGMTPFYAYDREKITERVKMIREYLPNEIHLHYAMKANPMIALVQHLAHLVDGIDVASMGELGVALDTTIRPEKISFAGPAKTKAALSCAIAAGVVVNMESDQEMTHIAKLGKILNIRPKVAVRVNPNFELKFSGVKMSGGSSQFGVDAEFVPKMLARLQTLELDFVGFHIFCGSQNLNAAAIQEAHKEIFQLSIRLAQYAPTPVHQLNIGGGFGVPYFPGDQALDLAAIGENLHRLLPMLKQALPESQIVIELGRYFVAEAGIYVCSVLERKISRGRVLLVTDGGLHHHLAASGNFGQVIRKNFPVIVGNKVQSCEKEVVSVVGPLCTPLDLLADQMEIAKVCVGDLIVILQSGAYGLTASPTAFLNHPLPREVLV